MIVPHIAPFTPSAHRADEGAQDLYAGGEVGVYDLAKGGEVLVGSWDVQTGGYYLSCCVDALVGARRVAPSALLGVPVVGLREELRLEEGLQVEASDKLRAKQA